MRADCRPRQAVVSVQKSSLHETEMHAWPAALASDLFKDDGKAGTARLGDYRRREMLGRFR